MCKAALYSMFSLFALLSCDIQNVFGQEYTNIAPQVGMDVTTLSSDNFGSGVSFFDFDQDGWDDLTFTSDSSVIRMYRNVNGEFVEIYHNIPPLGLLKEATWFDYDQDGLMDLLTSSRYGKYKLFKNTGDFQFNDVSVQAGLYQVNQPHYGVAIGDYNKDGYLDFYVCVYALGGEDNFFAYNQLYRNNSDGTFTNVTSEAGVGGGIAASFDAAWMDYNADGWPDLYVINDRQPFSNVMYKNNGDGTFSDVTEQTNTGYLGQFPMTVSVGDFDNDADLDIYLTNIGGELNTELLENDGTGYFSETGLDWGVQHNNYSWGALWVDRDNDGRRDLYVATSPIGASAPVYKDLFYNNMGDHFVLNQSALTDLAVERSYGLAKGDLNNDGYNDIVTHSIDPYPANLWLNSGGVQNYVKVTLEGTVSNQQAIGSWIHVYAGGQQYTEYTRCDDNYVSQNSQHLIFGMGMVENVDSLTVLYPSGHVDRYYDLAVNQHHYLTEGETYTVELDWNDNESICAGDSVIVDAGDHPSYYWSSGDTSQTLVATESGTYWVAVQNEYGVTLYSDTLEITVNSNPDIQYEVQKPACYGDNNGAISIQNVAGVPDDIVIWDNGSIGSAIDSLFAGLYNYTFVDVNGCEATGEVLVQEPLPLSVLLFTEPDNGSNNGSLMLIINGGTPPYQVYLNGLVQDSELMTDLSAGLYELLVSDDYSCSFFEEVEVASITSLDKHDAHLLGIHPNPISPGQSLMIEGAQSEHLVRLELYDLRGVRIWKHVIPEQHADQYQLPIIPVESGRYHLRFFFDGQRTISMPLVVTGRHR